MEKTLEQRLIWLAGIVDGEGTITYWLSKSKHIRKDGVENKYVRMSVAIANTNETIINEILDIANAANSPVKLCFQPRTGTGHKGCWYVSWQGANRVKDILVLLLPWLVGKRPQAALMLSIIERRASTRSRTQVSVEQDKWLKNQLDSLTALNRRGVQ